MTWSTWSADPLLWIIAGCFPIAAVLFKGLGATWRQAIAATAGVYAVAFAAGGGLSFFI